MIETDDEGFGFYCGNCHCADCEAARAKEAEEERVREYNRTHPMHGPLTFMDYVQRDAMERLWDAMLNAKVDPNCPPGMAYLLEMPKERK